eukprot:TRINITY_DN75052_c0_g1_i1.p1 TRINITY_DN75052_c0_g1~~TRINITY_DN75052_c0_g1_i1.p1  ORF type:complete len:435 (+),score=61.79 TRINITY_DN75052_c0_g1_i1:83-1306(+)
MDRKPSETINKEGTGSWPDAPFGYDTMCVHGGTNPDDKTGAIFPPLYMCTTFVQSSIAEYQQKGYSYSRTSNPTCKELEKRLCAMENGAGAAVFATGMAATNTILSAFLRKGDHCVITDCSYGGTNRVCRVLYSTYGVEFSFVDFSKPEEVEKACKPNTKLIFSESPVNPILKLCDVAAISKIAKAKGIPHACDSTFATPVIMRVLDLGADFAVQSTTKYYDGHNIGVGGAIISATKENADKIHFMQNMHGNIMHPMMAYMTLQTSKTMAIRVRQQSKNAQAVAEFLQTHPKVEKVCYPGLKTHPQYELAQRQHLDGVHGGMLWFEVKGGVEAGTKLMDTAQRPWSLCENLGAVESIITAPAVMTHANMLKEDREKAGISDGFIRISCGIEEVDDLIRSLKTALDNL